MADDAVQGSAPVEDAEVGSGKPTTGPVPLETARAQRQAKIAAFRAGAATAAAGTATPPPESERTETKPADPAPKVDKVELKKPAEDPKADEIDPQTQKGLSAIEKRDQRARTQLAADKAAQKAEIDAERAEVARMKAELASKTTSLDELKKLPPAKRALEALKAVGLEDEEAMEVVARQTWALSKSGKADPKNKVYAEQLAEKQGVSSELAELRKLVEETREQLTTTHKQAAAEKAAAQWLDEGVKVIPAEPTFIGQAHAANPAKARSALLAVGQRMLREAIEENGGRFDPTLEPTHAEVIARYEADKRQAFKDDGFTDEQIAALLKKPTTITAPVKKPPATLDVTATRTTPTINGNGQPTRDEKIAKARADRLKANATAS